MPYPAYTMLDVKKDALKGLDESQLEELVGRLAEAEVVACGGQHGEVQYGGSTKATDDGVDVCVNVTSTTLKPGFIPRPNTIFQCKKPKMPRSAILSEMKRQGVLRPAIAEQNTINGGYVIVSLDDDCTVPMRNNRNQAMEEAAQGHDDIVLKFIDVFKLHQWLRQHPSVMTWTREVLGQPLFGWQPFGQWSYVPNDAEDKLILDSGISVLLPHHSSPSQKLTLEEAITSTRKLVNDSPKAIRIVGLPGVGKTRFVQALFETEVGEGALDKTAVIYTDTGISPNPSAFQMIEQLIRDEEHMTVVVDNCSSALHSDLTVSIQRRSNDIQLITVEYDIRDDQPRMTDVIKIESDGVNIAKELIQRHYPKIDQRNAERIAGCAGGNARIALALADNVSTIKNVAQLSDEDLFERIFQQRRTDDQSLKQHAEILSLVYSFAVEKEDGVPDELAVLGRLCDASPIKLYASSQKLLDRGIAKERDRLRAVIPEAIANRLAKQALHHTRLSDLQNTFEAPNNDRLITSFAHRLGLLGDPPDPYAQKIVKAWLSDGGLLHPILSLNETKARILEYIIPVCPGLLLDRFEDEINDSTFTNLSDYSDDILNEIVNLIIILAKDSIFFERCINLLLMVKPRNDPSEIEKRVLPLFQPYLSGTRASAQQRANVVKRFIWSDEKRLQDIGIKMLSKTLVGPPGDGLDLAITGFSGEMIGYDNISDEEAFQNWRQLFISITIRSCLDDDSNRNQEARKIFAQYFGTLWSQNTLHGQLIESAKELNNHYPWIDGWKAINETIYRDYKAAEGGEVDNPIPDKLLELRDFLTPNDLESNFKVYLTGDNQPSAIDTEFDGSSEDGYEAAEARIKAKIINLGEQVVESSFNLENFGIILFSGNYLPNGHNFGIGLAKGSKSLNTTWNKLVARLKSTGVTSPNYEVLEGFIHETARMNKKRSSSILDACLKDSLLRRVIVPLHPRDHFTEDDFDRCIKAIENPDVNPPMYECFLWQSDYSHLPKEKKLHLARMLLEHRKGTETLIRGLGMKIRGSDNIVDTLGPELCQIGLSVAIKYLNMNDDRSNSDVIYDLEAIIRDSLGYAGNEDMKSQLLDTVFSKLDVDGYSPVHGKIFQAMVDILPEAFLDKLFSGDEQQQLMRRKIFEFPFSINEESILISADIGRIIQWCLGRDEPFIWATIAQSLPVFISNGDNETVVLSDASIRFLEASPYPKDVLTCYATQIAPTTGLGHQSFIMEKNIGAFRTLVKHENQQISTIASGLCRKAESAMAELRESE